MTSVMHSDNRRGFGYALISFRIFPRHWDWRRIMEFGIASYQACVGAVAFVHPQTLNHSSYAELMTMFSPQLWGLTLWTIAVAHAMCVATNGKHPLYSGSLRVLACTWHLGVMLLIGIAYYKVEDYYRLVTTFFLVLGVLAAMSIATEDIAWHIRRRRVIADERRRITPDGDA